MGYVCGHAAWTNDFDPLDFVRRMAGWGVQFTDLWLMNAWSYAQPHEQPWVRLSDGRFDLTRWSEPWFDRLGAFVADCAAAGIVVQLTLMDRYVLTRVPDPLHPVRHNLQGVQWGVPDEDTFLYAPPDPYLVALVPEVVRRFGLFGPIRLANEFKEKPWHFAFADAIRAFAPDACLYVNRQEDSPGQYLNMQVGQGRIDGYEFHGGGAGGPAECALKRGVSALDAVWPKETDAGRPDTMRKLIDSLQRPQRGTLTICTDGGRSGGPVSNGYDYPNWQDVGAYTLQVGASFLHQSCVKLAEPMNLDDMRYDEPMMLALSATYR